jgi:diguanylate cyclase (GGDEF)-like protein/putative nucleotidyltransferase with HDIG domain
MIDSNHVANPILGILSASTIFSATFYLLRKLINERDKYHKLSTTDSLTGLSTLKHFVDKGQKILDQNPVAAVLVIDLDHFKQINDTYGHLTGNKILIEISEILKKEMIDTSSIIGRLGGDEFVIFLYDIQGNQVSKIANRLSLCFKNHAFYVNPALPPINVSLTIGEAYSIQTKKLSIQELLNQADSNMYYKKHGEYKLAYNSVLDKIKLPDKCKQFLKTLEEKDAYTYIHSQYVAQYAAELAKALGLSEMKVKEIYISGLIHDIGKLYIPNGVLRKPGKLTQEEYTVIKDHVTDGLDMLKDLSISKIALSGIKYHHERFDGNGYPNGIKGSDTPLEGRIVQIADAFSAMTIKRVYRESLSVEDALNELIKNSGSQFDPELVDMFINLFKEKKSAI